MHLRAFKQVDVFTAQAYRGNPLAVLAPVLATGVPWCERTPGTTPTPHGPVTLTSL